MSECVFSQSDSRLSFVAFISLLRRFRIDQKACGTLFDLHLLPLFFSLDFFGGNFCVCSPRRDSLPRVSSDWSPDQFTGRVRTTHYGRVSLRARERSRGSALSHLWGVSGLQSRPCGQTFPSVGLLGSSIMRNFISPPNAGVREAAAMRRIWAGLDDFTPPLLSTTIIVCRWFCQEAGVRSRLQWRQAPSNIPACFLCQAQQLGAFQGRVLNVRHFLLYNCGNTLDY